MKLYLRENVLRVAIAQAAEVFPKEAIGYLLGTTAKHSIYSDNIFTFQSAERRDPKTVALQDEAEFRVQDILEDDIVADWHSHCNEPPILSRIRDFVKREDQVESDEWDMRNNPIYPGHSLILAIWPIKNGWKTRLAYYYLSNRIRRGEIRIV